MRFGDDFRFRTTIPLSCHLCMICLKKRGLSTVFSFKHMLYERSKIVFTLNNLLKLKLSLFFLWHRIDKCNTSERLDALCEEIRKERNIVINVTHGRVSIVKLLKLTSLIVFVSPLLKPQDSFGEFDNFFLDLQKVHEIIRKHHHTFLQLFGMTYCNAILPNGKLSLCT